MKTKLILTLFAGVAIMTLYQTCAPRPAILDPAVRSKIEASPQFKAGGFHRQKDALNMSFMDNAKATWKFLFSGNDRTPDQPLPLMPSELSHFNANGDTQLNATWLGHSSLMINIDGYKVLTDPVFEKRISIVGPTRFSGDLPVTIDQLPLIDAVIISHDHYDHLNKWSIRQLKAKTKQFIVPLAVGAHLEKWGVPRECIVELDWWEEYRLNDNLMVAATPAQHFSGRGLSDRNKTLWASWVISGPAHKIFFSGDSGYFNGFRQIGDKYGPFDMTFLECGAYDLMWHKVHMLPEETIQAHLDLRGKVLHPIHWGTFNLALHPWYQPMERIIAAAEQKNINLATPMIGETTRYEQPVPTGRWWQYVLLEN